MRIKRETIRPIQRIRFRRWSRKPYAVFAGLHKNISIGRLAKGVTEKLLPKTNTMEILVIAGSHLSLLIKSMEETLSQEDNLPVCSANMLSESCSVSF